MDPTDPGGPSYGLGLAKLGPMLGFGGELPGFDCVIAYDAKRKLTLVVWTTLGAAPDGRPPATTMAKAIMGELYPPAP